MLFIENFHSLLSMMSINIYYLYLCICFWISQRPPVELSVAHRPSSMELQSSTGGPHLFSPAELLIQYCRQILPSVVFSQATSTLCNSFASPTLLLHHQFVNISVLSFSLLIRTHSTTISPTHWEVKVLSLTSFHPQLILNELPSSSPSQNFSNLVLQCFQSYNFCLGRSFHPEII